MTRALPSGLRYRLAEGGGAAWYWASRAQRRNALGNYAAVLGLPREDPRVARVARRAFMNYGQMLADFVLLAALSREELIARTSIDGRDHLDVALAAGRGCIMAVPHMGSWDVGVSYAGALGLRIAAVTERFPGSLNEAVVETRVGFGLEVILPGRSAVGAIGRALKANSIVALICDLPHGPGVEVEFFGRPAVVPAGPAALAARTGASLLPAFVYRTSPGRYHIHLDQPLPVPKGPADKDVQRSLMQQVVARFEEFIRERPEQWYAFRPLFGN